MSLLAQGTQIYFIDDTGSDTDVVTVQCATAFNPGGSPADQLDDTCLEDFEASNKAGLRRPGVATIGLNADPANSSHVLMHELYEMNPSPILKWAVGWPDGTAPPTVDVGGDFVLPTTRTWYTMQGYISDFPFDHALSALITTTISIQRSGGFAWIAKV